jgi:Bacterial regulatory proteins, tetR family
VCNYTGPVHARKPAGAAVPRPEKTEAIIAAFFTELADSGYERLTMDRVVARAGVGKAKRKRCTLTRGEVTAGKRRDGTVVDGP